MPVQPRSNALLKTTADAAASVAAGVPASAQAALALHAALLSSPRLADAAGAAVREVAHRMADDLAWLALAEGVQEAPRAALSDLPCDSYQGFLCSPALPPQEFVARLREINGD